MTLHAHSNKARWTPTLELTTPQDLQGEDPGFGYAKGSLVYKVIKALQPSRAPRTSDILYQQYLISLTHRYTIEDRKSQVLA